MLKQDSGRGIAAMKIIINADDLGMSTKVNDAVFALMAARRITSATLLANGAEVEDAVQRTRALPHCSFGAHLNLSQFRPLTSHPGLQPILDSDGCFAGNRLREIKISSSLREGIFCELSAQVERLLGLGVRLSHFDSHHHMHTVPGIFPVVKQLQKRFGIRKVRLTMNIYPPEAPAPVARRAAKVLWNCALRQWYRTKTTGSFTSLAIFAALAKEKSYFGDSVELMVHPGSLDFESETELLWKDWTQALPFAAQLISYNEL